MLKALANEDTLLLMMFLGLRKLGNICCGHKMFLNKIRNIFCVPDRKFVSATNDARAGKRGNICGGSHCWWLHLKCSTIGIGFAGAETNCGIARILGILLMNSYGNKISTGAAHPIVVCPLRMCPQEYVLVCQGL